MALAHKYLPELFGGKVMNSFDFANLFLQDIGLKITNRIADTDDLFQSICAQIASAYLDSVAKITKNIYSVGVLVNVYSFKQILPVIDSNVLNPPYVNFSKNGNAFHLSDVK